MLNILDGIAFNSLSRDHKGLPYWEMPPYETQNFQLPLSGSRTLTQHAFGAMASVTAFQLPLSGSLHARQRLDDSRHSRYPFNSLSRDHEIWPRGYVINRESELSTPSLGITSRLSRRPFSCADMASFQLPLSGSHAETRETRDERERENFQLPLSGSPLLRQFDKVC